MRKAGLFINEGLDASVSKE